MNPALLVLFLLNKKNNKTSSKMKIDLYLLVELLKEFFYLTRQTGVLIMSVLYEHICHIQIFHSPLCIQLLYTNQILLKHKSPIAVK